MIKKALAFAAFFTLSCNLFADSILETKNFTITITVICSEGNVTCDDVSILIKEKDKKETKHLNGHTIHTYETDGVTPSRFLGYEAKTKQGLNYQILESGELIIMDQANQMITDETGTWKR